MTELRALDRLADLAGIEPQYHDIWGRLHRATPETKRKLLQAMGVPAGDDGEVQASIRALAEAEWQEPLPPVLVVTDGETVLVPLSLPIDAGERKVTVEIEQEDGTVLRFEVLPSSLSRTATAIIGRTAMERRLFEVPRRLPLGYHECRLLGIACRPLRLIVAPRRCYLPEPLAANRKLWGLSAHVYTLRSRRDWGIGDFTDLTDLIDVCAGAGAAAVGVNPLHALFPGDPERASPYSPSSRLFLNPLYLDVDKVLSLTDCPSAKRMVEESEGKRATARDRRFIDYATVAALKQEVLDEVHRCLRSGSAESLAKNGENGAFQQFREDYGERLQRFATFEALSEHFDGTPWPQWPRPYRDPRSPEVATFAAENQHRIEFHAFLQWQTDLQLAAAQERCADLGLAIGIYRDLAVGVDPHGADAWSEPNVIVSEASVGAPPDPFNMLGQDWGTPPLSPRALIERAYEPFIAMIRANMRHAGALRIDHVMGLRHLFWIPAGEPAAAGAYITYPFDDLLGVVALESLRNRCLVIGEDLGTVPEGFRERLAAANILSYRVLYFEKDGNRFKRPDEYPQLALACVSTHDLSTFAGFWKGADIELKQRLNLYPSPTAVADEWSARSNDRQLLLEALSAERLLADGELAADRAEAPISEALVAAVHGYLSRSPAQLLMVQLDDITGEEEQLNLPGTVDEHPNWRRRVGIDVDAIASVPVMRALRRVLAKRSAKPSRAR
jgi:4-alpha-glucanotransferase